METIVITAAGLDGIGHHGFARMGLSITCSSRSIRSSSLQWW
jgi:hypothetical protein